MTCMPLMITHLVKDDKICYTKSQSLALRQSQPLLMSGHRVKREGLESSQRKSGGVRPALDICD